MRLNYIINNDPSHRVVININPATKSAQLQYIRTETIVQQRSMSVAEVIELEPTKNPQVQVAKRGYLWDLHVYKTDVKGNELRRTLSIATPVEIVSTQLEMVNDGVTDITLKDYITQPLDVYSSKLTLVENTFDKSDGLTGTSGNAATTPVVTPDGYLELGHNAEVHVPMSASVDMSTTGFAFVLGIIGLGANDVSGDYQLGIRFGSAGSNLLKFDANKGVLFSAGSIAEKVILPATAWGSRIDLMIEVGDNVAKLWVNGNSATLSDFQFTEIMDHIVLTAMCNDDETSRVDYVLVQKMKG